MKLQRNSKRNHVTFYLNGIRQDVGPEHARMMLADYLRESKRLVGTKIVCAEGDCGACTVLRLPPQFSKLKRAQRFVTINSCIATVAQMDGSSLVTVDALAFNQQKSEAAYDHNEEHPHPTIKLHPAQKSMMESHGSQCGFCTPGFVMVLAGLAEKKLLEKKAAATCGAKEAMNAMTGNLCRCTGYQPIIDAATRMDLKGCPSAMERFTDKGQMKTLAALTKRAVYFENEKFSFYAPTKLSDAAKYLAKNKNVRIVGAATDLGVIHNKGKIELTQLLSLHLIPELYDFKVSAKTIRVGARVSLSELRHLVKKPVPEFATFLDLFASPQIKNAATLVGNIGNASPIADTPPFLLATNAVLHLIGPRGNRKLKFDQYYLGYRKTALKTGEIIVAVEFEIPQKSESLKLYKVSQRKDLDISAMNAAIRIQWAAGKAGGKIQDVRIALGGVAATPVRLRKTETYLRGKQPLAHPEVLKEAADLMQSEITPLDDLRGTSTFRRVLVQNLFHKFFRELVS